MKTLNSKSLTASFMNENSVKIINIVIIIMTITIVIGFITTAFYREVNVDASYYLGAVELIYNGFIPVKDFQLSYTPFSFYFLQLFRHLTSEPHYTLYLLVYYAFTFASSFLIFLITKEISKSKTVGLLLQLYFLTMVYLFEGTYIVIEPFVTFTGLLSFWVILKKESSDAKIILSGFFAGLAFMSKQYGLAFIAANSIYILLSHNTINDKVKKTIFILIGFVSMPLLFTIYLLLNGVSAYNIYESFLGGGYGQKNIEQWLSGIRRIITSYREFPSFLLITIIFAPIKDLKNAIILAYSVILLFLFSLQFYFQVYDHYYILIFPALILIIAFLYRSEKQYIRVFVFLILLLLTSYNGKKIIINTMRISKSDVRKTQYQRVDKLKPLLKDVKSIYCLGAQSLPYYYLFNIKPAIYEKYGFQFGFESSQQIQDRILSADAIVIDKILIKSHIAHQDYLRILLSEYKIIGEAYDVLIMKKIHQK